MKKERLDKLVVQLGLTESREQAKRLIMAGQIYDENNQRYDKPGEKIPADKELHIKGKTMPYVSRGGLKLEKAIKVFDIDMTNQRLLDIGASTGGFTDAALQFGAEMSYALDVGYNQLAYSLRIDSRVEVMERQNFRYSTPADFTRGVPTIASIDVSFISLRLILPPLVDILANDGIVLALIKPQFEAGRERIGKNGIVKDASVHQDVLEEVLQFASSIGYVVEDLTFSPITGGEGNIEFLAKLRNAKQLNNQSWKNVAISEIVAQAHETF
ncbi:MULTISPECIES: TlyA family RNA methyltransferase [unclassified Facklamia]|uniref:TlyA family RNA methyltransferase n=1 Tax=Aerococcaceae TaxID=186827 RepID=UPI0013BA226C|nr:MULTISPECIES: TlyA family RNA methyltransferase [unclassified Facklamia]MBS4461503.1 TlyA family RNA methyltransferase [Aerococcaceae bacterium zg-B36]NEW63796.1 TlyA family rRNA (cytidine-2'-O)-methyltransferase [Facklamia sp. 252]NEW67267.1 TlyA family rRNA (cytidine-2'-O)-methyltransferase [Facklamia sp. 253]QQD65149.1 TlyA family RNA methyltransferase [Aerococcaceae bacterium zg-252]